jgi:hypothetical protein
MNSWGFFLFYTLHILKTGGCKTHLKADRTHIKGNRAQIKGDRAQLLTGMGRFKGAAT